MFKEFKEFAIKGNAIDMAVGIILGVAMGAIIASLVKDIIMPPIGLALGGLDFTNLFSVLKAGKDGALNYSSLKLAQDAGAVTINWGVFINTIINFLIVAFAVFMLVRMLNKMKKPAAAAAPVSKECPFCSMTIPVKARRCPHCTSEMSSVAGA